MAVNDKDNQQTTKPADSAMGSAFQAAQDARQTGQQQSGGSNRGALFSFRNTSSIARPAMGRNPASEVLSKLNKAMAKVYEENIDKSFEYTLIPIDMNSTTTLSVSVLVLAMREKAAPETGVAFHTLILEASAEAPAPRFENIGGQNVEILRTVGEAYDQNMVNVVAEAVQRQYPNTTLLNAEAEVIPRDFNVADEETVYKLASNAAFAASSELETNRRGFTDMNLANAEKDSTLTVRTSFGNGPVTDAVNHPLRADIKIDFSAAPLNQQNNQQAVERVTPVAHLDGYIDLVWDPAQTQQNPFGAFNQPTPNSYQRYAARYVLTAVESQSLLTISAQLLALLPALSLRENNAWVQAFRPQTFGGLDLHDIGAVGIEANFEGNPSGYGTRIDTKADTFKPEHLFKLITATVKPGLILSLDVPECGPQTWYNGVFAAAAGGNQNAAAAIVNAANTLTNGNFAKHFQPNGRIALDEDNRIHLGYYIDSNGVKKDIRDIDYLAIMNLVGEKDPAIIRQWSDTFHPVAPLAIRLAKRKQIIQGLFADVTFTGFARRVTFEAEFIEALAKAVAETGLQIRSISPYADVGSFERAAGGYGNTLLSGEATGLFNRGGFGQPQSFGSNRAFGVGSGRW